jgi:glucose repression regulatory protein TUP1
MGQGLPPLHGASPAYGSTGPGSSQHGGGDNPNSSNSLGLIPLSTSGPSSSGIPPGPGSTLGPVGLSLAGTTTPGATSSFPEEFNVHNILPEFKKEGNDWFAIFNPKVKRVLDVNLVHTLMHERCVCMRVIS